MFSSIITLVANFPVLATICLLAIGLYSLALRRNQFWNQHRMPHVPGIPFLGNLSEVIRGQKCPTDLFYEIYNHENTKNSPVCGIELFHKPAIFVRDVQLVKQILIKDFGSFSERYSQADTHDKLASNNLFFARNPLWRRIRVRLSSFFTSNKLRHLFPLVTDVANEMDQQLTSMSLDNAANGSFVTEVKDFCGRYSTDVIASCAFGIQANCVKDSDSAFRQTIRSVFHFTWSRMIEISAIFFLPQVVNWFGIRVFSKQSTILIREIMDYVINERETTNSHRNDFIDKLIELKNENAIQIQDGNSEAAFENDELLAQAAVFLTTQESSSTTMSFALYELARNPIQQELLRQEIKRTLLENQGQISYDTLNSMTYLHMVVSETLRLHPFLPFLERQCTNQEDGYSLEPFHDFVVPKGMAVIIPSAAIHRNPEYFPDPDRFDPERFAPANKDNIEPTAFLSFGAGPHHCIGQRFGWMQSKLGLLHVLKSHYVTPSDRMPEKTIYSKRAAFLQMENGIYVNFVHDQLV